MPTLHRGLAQRLCQSLMGEATSAGVVPESSLDEMASESSLEDGSSFCSNR